VLQRGQLYLHTIRHLRLRQILGRIERRLKPAPRVSNRSLPVAGRVQIGSPSKPRTLMGPKRWRFLNIEEEVASPQDWNRAGRDPLWTFNLHYFDDLNSSGSAERTIWHKEWIRQWVQDNPPPSGAGWEPYTISLRTVNWIKWDWRNGGTLSPEERASLAQQARFLRASLEYHLGGNHLWANAKALIFSGLYFAGEEADELLRLGLELMEVQIEEQILEDGGHYELSTMYHAILTEDLLELIELSRARGLDVERWEETAGRMLRWLQAMCHGDGEIAFFNDAAFGIASPPEQIFAYAGKLGLKSSPLPSGLVHLEASGYVRYQEDELLLLADVAAVGPDELPGHAHADTLSFELSHGSSRIFVNSGTSSYWDPALRGWQRGTASHNTVVIDGADSSEVWSRFRVARRARPQLLELSGGKDGLLLRASHDGYSRLSGKPEHIRSWRMQAGNLLITDEINGGFANAQAFFYLHPGVKAELSGEKHARIEAGGKKFNFAADSPLEMAEASHYPFYGLVQPAHVIRRRILGTGSRVEFSF
jgi:uncharacterized heparinase superfamily protein